MVARLRREVPGLSRRAYVDDLTAWGAGDAAEAEEAALRAKRESDMAYWKAQEEKSLNDGIAKKNSQNTSGFLP